MTEETLEAGSEKTLEQEKILEVRDLRLSLSQKTILDGLTMEFWPGHVHAVIGPNGAGKSTLAATVMGLGGYRDHQGDILYRGESVKSLDPHQRANLGLTLAWQEPARFEGLSVERFILAGAQEKSRERAAEALELLGLDPKRYLDRAVDRTLSGGERKRVELASILAMEPELVIMDEPDSGIDVEALNRIFDAIGVLRERGATVLLITHSLTVLKQADHGFLICDGRLVHKGSVEKIQSFYADECMGCDHKNEPDDEVMEAQGGGRTDAS